MPIRVLLGLSLVLLAAWFAVLRPGDEAVTPQEPAAAAPSAPAEPAPAAPATPVSAPAAPAAATGDRAAKYVAALDRGKAVVLLFWSRAATDDRAVRAAVRKVDRRGGKVLVGSARLTDVARFESITSGVQITQSPTVLVISPARQARRIVGLTTVRELDQAVADALRDRAPVAPATQADVTAAARRVCAGDTACLAYVEAFNARCRGSRAAAAAERATPQTKTDRATRRARAERRRLDLVNALEDLRPPAARRAAHVRAVRAVRDGRSRSGLAKLGFPACA